MNSLCVSNNIKMCKENIQKLLVQKNEIEKEILRLEGSIRTFENFKKLGIEKIHIETTEVVDNENEEECIAI